MQYLVHDFNDNTIRFVLRYPGLLEPQRLCRAVFEVIARADVLHASFHPGKIRAHWSVHADFTAEDCFELVKAEGDPVPQALALALRPIRPEDKAQLHCTLVQGGGQCAVIFRISHLCVDGSDGRYLLERVAQAYDLLERAGSCDALRIKHGSRAAEQAYEALSREEVRSLMRDPRSGIKSEFPYPTQEAGEASAVWRLIPAGVMDAARQRARREGATANDLLLAACYCAYADVPGVRRDAPMSIMSMMDLRRHCRTHDSQGLSNLTGSLPTQLPGGADAPFEAVLTEIARQTAQLKEDPYAGLAGMPLLHSAVRTLPMGLLLAASDRLYGSMAVGLTNLGNIDCGALAMGGLRPDMGWFGGPLKKKPGMQVSAASFDGACMLGVVGRYTQEDARVLQRMLDAMAQAVGTYAGK